MTELPAQPYRESDQRRVDEFYSLPSMYPNLQWIARGLEMVDLAARLGLSIACELRTRCSHVQATG